MKKTKTLLFLIAVTAALLAYMGCSELAEDQGEFASPHPAGWLDPSSSAFHGAAISLDSLESLSCAACHAPDNSGEPSAVSCFDCHHAADWADPEVHGDSVISADFDLDLCASCHYSGENETEQIWDCWECHLAYPHPLGFAVDEHADLIQEVQYQVWRCESCHGGDYSGGVSEFSCLICHEQSPEACNTCHGNLDADPQEMASWAPPLDLSNSLSTDSITVGAHTAHVNPGSLANQPWIGGPYSCNECHILPIAVNSAAHLDDQSPLAEVAFGWIASDGNVVSPVWNGENGTCTDTYCHGDFELGNPDNALPEWTNLDGTQLQCGSCHLLPPPLPHIQNDDCHLCHGNVVGPDNLTIIAPQNHADGDVN
jgi:predicted CxxxxCH...CXXCH cytochrome family protein